eukprot:4192233-Amphidinium_carterae.1
MDAPLFSSGCPPLFACLACLSDSVDRRLCHIGCNMLPTVRQGVGICYMSGLLRKLSPTDFMSCKINMNYYMESSMLQAAMELPLEKKAGRLYAPPGNLQLVYFIDDLNMPALDKYNTQSGIELLKQKQDLSALRVQSTKRFRIKEADGGSLFK